MIEDGYPMKEYSCIEEGCSAKRAGPTSLLCRTHRVQLSNHRHGDTSDGRRTGSTPKMTPEDIIEARRMYSEFKTRAVIARHFGVSLNTLRRHL